MRRVEFYGDLYAKAAVVIDAPVSEVWKAITTPELIRRYYFEAETITDWQPGHPITWKGLWKGRAYTDKGVVLDVVPGQLLRVTCLSPLSGKEDKPENYATVTYHLSADGDQTPVTVTQDNLDNEEAVEKMNRNWAMALTELKNMLEKAA